VKKGFAPQDGGETWRVWEQPQPGVPYIAALDPSDDEETDRGELAWNAIQIINHRTRSRPPSTAPANRPTLSRSSCMSLPCTGTRRSS
jgi:hypothetical protein